jgi:hypothetical protein
MSSAFSSAARPGKSSSAVSTTRTSAADGAISPEVCSETWRREGASRSASWFIVGRRGGIAAGDERSSISARSSKGLENSGTEPLDRRAPGHADGRLVTAATGCAA